MSLPTSSVVPVAGTGMEVVTLVLPQGAFARMLHPDPVVYASQVGNSFTTAAKFDLLNKYSEYTLSTLNQMQAVVQQYAPQLLVPPP